MNYITILILPLLPLTIVEFVLADYPSARRQLFNIAFIYTAVWVTIKYCIGPDIMTYYPYYESLGSPTDILSGDYDKNIEVGFTMFCSLCKAAGMTFWMMTATISLLYFTPLYIILKQIDKYQTFALLIIAVLDYNLMLYEFRQCLAVSLFMWAYVMYRHKHMIVAMTLVLLTLFIHKSAIVFILILGIGYTAGRIATDKRAYMLLVITFILFLIIPLSSLMEETTNILPLSKDVKDSIVHHLSQGELMQIILPVYAAAIFCIAYYSDFDRREMKWHIIIWICMLTITVLFQQWLLLNRLRSYFLPFLLVYLFNTVARTKRRDMLAAQLSIVIFIGYSIAFTYGNYKTNLKMKSQTNNISTVLDRMNMSEKEITDRQIKEAEKFWDYDYREYVIEEE